ncbi:MAG: hypothetical protein JNL79_19240, partial [Myxococcales bacterium]|nr:hypothetical protein [Myxococcales bacterium]
MALISAAPLPTIVTLADRTGADADFVQFGLFDGAFDPPAKLLNSDFDESKNFVGSDSRRFFVRVRDLSTMTKSAKKRREVKATLRTYYDDKKSVHDDGGADPNITLIETSPGSGIYESSWLLLSSDPWEVKAKNVLTTSGRAGLGFRSHGEADYRLRLASMFGYVGVEYPVKSGMVSLTPVFRRSPDERKNIPLQIFVLASNYSAGFEAYALGPDLDNVRAVYARLGLWVWTTTDPLQEAMPGVLKKTLGKESLLVIPVSSGVANPLDIDDGGTDCDLILTAFPGLTMVGTPGKSPTGTGPCITDTIRVVHVAKLQSGNAGSTMPDSGFANRACRGSSWIADSAWKKTSK